MQKTKTNRHTVLHRHTPLWVSNYNQVPTLVSPKGITKEWAETLYWNWNGSLNSPRKHSPGRTANVLTTVYLTPLFDTELSGCWIKPVLSVNYPETRLLFLIEQVFTDWLLCVETKSRGGEMTWWLSAPTALTEDLGSMPSVYTAAHGCLWCHFQGIWTLLLTSVGTGCTWHKDTHAGKAFKCIK